MSAKYDPFVATRLKIQRARHHIEVLESSLHRFAATNPFNFYITLHVDRPPTAIFGMICPIPPEVSLIAGDAVHCLRASLDILACELVKINNEKDEKVYFPFSWNEAELARQVKNKNFCRAGERAVELLYTVKPYKDGNVVLRSLHDLDIHDKHQNLIATRPNIHLKHFVIRYKAGSGASFKNVAIGVDLPIGLADLPISVEYVEPADVQVTFSNAAPEYLRGKVLIDEMWRLYAETSNVVDIFSREFSKHDFGLPDMGSDRHAASSGRRPSTAVKFPDGSLFGLTEVHAALSGDE